MIGLWKGSVAEQYVHYPRPQDSGNKEEVHYLTLTDKQNKGIRVDAVENVFSASSLHYTVQDIYEETHDCNLKPRAEIILSMVAFGNAHRQIDAGFMDSPTEPQRQEQGQHQETDH